MQSIEGVQLSGLGFKTFDFWSPGHRETITLHYTMLPLELVQ